MVSVYLQKSKTEPQDGCQTISQGHAVRRRERLWRTLRRRHRFTQSIVGEPQHLNIRGQHVSSEGEKEQQCFCDRYLQEKEHGYNLKCWADLTECLDLVPLIGHKISPPDADWRRV